VSKLFFCVGLLRLLLALVVILEHTQSSWHMTGGDQAVEAFFIISGFYMALILNEKYKGAGSTWLFYSNRLWRLFPLYWMLTFAVFAVSLLLWKTGHDAAWLAWWIPWGSHLSPTTWAYLVFVNLFALGQDTTFFLGIDHVTGQLSLVKNFRLTDPPVYRFLFIGQAWSMSVELMFYLLAPFLVRRRLWVIAGIFTLFLAFRLRLALSSFGFDPWIGRFLPAELPFFLAGVLGYWAYTWLRTRTVPPALMKAALGLVIGLTLTYQWLPATRYTALCYFTVFALCVPLAFLLTKSNRRDAAIGEYSFPIYIAHTLPLYFVHRICVAHGWSSDVEAIIELACVLPLAWMLIHFVGEPIEKIRARRAKQLLSVRLPQPAL